MENKTNEIMIILICIIIVIPLFIIAIYDRPSVDDYNYAILTRKVIEDKGNIFQLIKAAWDTNIKFYNSWQGLYTSAFILSLQPGIFGENFYCFTIFIVTGISYLCLMFSINILNKHFIKKSFLYTLEISTIIFTIIMLWIPSAAEGLYWYNGAMNYMPFLFFTILNLTLVYDCISATTKYKKIMLLIINILLSFIISGGNHIISFGNILSLLFFTLFYLKKDIKKSFYIGLPLLSACIGFLIMYIAPGTHARQILLHNKSVSETILATIIYLYETIPKWSSYIWAITLILFTPTAIDLANKNKDKFSDKFPWLPILCSLIIISGMHCVPYLAMGSFGAERVTNVLWITFMILSWLIYFFIVGYLVKKGIINTNRIKNNQDNIINIIYLICLILLILLPYRNTYSNSLRAITELLNGTAYSYSVEMDERIKLYNNKELVEIGVTPLKIKSELLFFNDLKTDPNASPNNYMGEYYNKKKIYLIDKNNNN